MTNQLPKTEKLFNKNKQRTLPQSMASNIKTNSKEKGVKTNKFLESYRNSYISVTVISITTVRVQTLTVSDCSKVKIFVI
jgi:hypothetical protein